jgi:hypothetical protein
VTVDGGSTVGLNSITLTVPASERHDGTAGTGARIVRSGGSENPTIRMQSANINMTIEWLEIDGGGGSRNGGVSFDKGSGGTATTDFATKLIIHDYSGGKARYGLGNTNRGQSTGAMNFLNNIIYDITVSSNNAVYGIDTAVSGANENIMNNSIFNIINNSSTGNPNASGIDAANSSNKVVKNNIAAEVGGSSSGTLVDFSFGGANVDSETNLSSDDTADDAGGSGHVISYGTCSSASDIFVSTTGGSEDFHLKSGSCAIDVGTDLGTSPTGVNFDIDNRDRDAEGDTWDIGADELVNSVIEAVAVGKPRTLRFGTLILLFGTFIIY